MNVQDFFNQNEWSKLQWLIFIMTFLVAFFDGLDTAVMGYIAPSLMQDWGIDKSQLVPVLSSALLGAAIGAIAFGPLADKIGRKKMLIFSVFLFSFICILSVFAQNLQQLIILRFITGLGLGAAMPNAVTLLSEYCPDQKRATMVNTMYCGFPIGAAVGGFIASWLIPNFGWKAMLLLSGGVPLLLSIVMIFLLPESVRYLLLKQKPQQMIQKILSRINSQAQQVSKFVLTEHVAAGNNKHPIAIILSWQLGWGTVLLWISFFCGLMIFYAIINWMPVLFKEAQMPTHLGSLVSGLFALGGLGAIVNGWLMDRLNGNLVIAFCTFITAIAVAFIGPSIQMGLGVFIFVMIVAGTMQNTAQSSLPVLAAQFYPTAARTTGVSWMCGIGRFGAVAGTMLMGVLVEKQLNFTDIFTIISIPAVIMTCCLLLKNALYPDSKKTREYVKQQQEISLNQ